MVPFFGLHVPTKCPGVPAKILVPRNTWTSKKRYDEKALELGRLFRESFKEFEDRVSKGVIAAQPTD